jgi:serine protease inhibitor
MLTKDQSSEITNARTSFAFSLYPQVAQDQVNQNILISPVSIILALMMAYNGADGETQAAMATTLQSTGISIEALNQHNQQWIEAIEKSDEHVQLQIANSLWGREGISFEEAFVDTVQEYYNAEVQSLDFDKSNASDKINRWVSDQTNDKIKQIVDKSINSDTILFLINAIYFDGKWSQPFNPKITKDNTFNLIDSTKKQHPFMNLSDTFQYLQEDKFQAVRLPYGDGAVSMYAFLPDESSSLQEFQAQLTGDNWSTWLSSLQVRKGTVALPKFKLEYELNLKKALTEMGMGIAFKEGTADLSRMVVDKQSNPFISSVKHSTFIDVQEEGTEAAAVTSIEVSVTSLDTSAPQPFEMKLDRPFFFIIADNQTGAILFMGSIYEPQQ